MTARPGPRSRSAEQPLLHREARRLHAAGSPGLGQRLQLLRALVHGARRHGRDRLLRPGHAHPRRVRPDRHQAGGLLPRAGHRRLGRHARRSRPTTRRPSTGTTATSTSPTTPAASTSCATRTRSRASCSRWCAGTPATSRRPPAKTTTRSTAAPAARSRATLSLTMGTPAAFGAFTPGLAKDYTATTTANVISTAGDAHAQRVRSVLDGDRSPDQRHVLAAVGPAGQGDQRCRRRRRARRRRRLGRADAAADLLGSGEQRRRHPGASSSTSARPMRCGRVRTARR